MDKIRIGNDIAYKWVILRHDKYIEDFTVAKIVELKISNDSTGETYLPVYDINNNVITVYFPASVQIKCGVHSLHINYTKENGSGIVPKAEYAVDYEGVFELVAQTSEETPAIPEDGKVISYVYRNRDGANGKDAITPGIGPNGNWFIGLEDTGSSSMGKPFTYDMFTPEQIVDIQKPAIDAAEKVSSILPDLDAKIIQHNSSAASHSDIRDEAKTSIGLPEFDEVTRIATFIAKNGSTKTIHLKDDNTIYTGGTDDDGNLTVDVNDITKTITTNFTPDFISAFNDKADLTSVNNMIQKVSNEEEALALSTANHKILYLWE